MSGTNTISFTLTNVIENNPTPVQFWPQINPGNKTVVRKNSTSPEEIFDLPAQGGTQTRIRVRPDNNVTTGRKLVFSGLEPKVSKNPAKTEWVLKFNYNGPNTGYNGRQVIDGDPSATTTVTVQDDDTGGMG